MKDKNRMKEVFEEIIEAFKHDRDFQLLVFGFAFCVFTFAFLCFKVGIFKY